MLAPISDTRAIPHQTAPGLAPMVETGAQRVAARQCIRIHYRHAARPDRLQALRRPRRVHPRGHRPDLGGPGDRLHPRELRAGLDRARRLRHVDDPGRGHRGQPDADRGPAGPDRPGRRRHLGGARRRRVPQLPPGPLRPTPERVPEPDHRQLPLPSRPDGRGVGRARLAGHRPAARTGSRTQLARAKAFRGYVGLRPSRRQPDVLAVGDSGPRPDDFRPEVELVLEFIQQVWNDRDLEKVEDFMVRDLVLHTVGYRTFIRPEGYRRALLQPAALFPSGQFEVRDIADQLRRALRGSADRGAAGSSPAPTTASRRTGRSPAAESTCWGSPSS